VGPREAKILVQACWARCRDEVLLCSEDKRPSLLSESFFVMERVEWCCSCRDLRDCRECVLVMRRWAKRARNELLLTRNLAILKPRLFVRRETTFRSPVIHVKVSSVHRRHIGGHTLPCGSNTTCEVGPSKDTGRCKGERGEGARKRENVATPPPSSRRGR
jgi:hypothetical protein